MDLGPAYGTLTLHTGRQGVAARVGHDLTVTVGRWSARWEDGAVAFEADLASLTVVRGDGGLKPLSDRDKATILRTAGRLLEVDQHPTVTAAADGVEAAGGSLHAEVSIAGVTRSVPVEVAVTGGDPARVVVTATVRQTAFGISPYSAMLGTLRVADDVGVRLELTVPRG